MELDALQQNLNEIRSTGASLVAISPQREEFLRQMAEKHHLAFDLLHDEGNAVAAKFGLVFKLPDDLHQLYASFGVDLARYNGDDSWTLPVPARYVIGANGVVRHVDADPDYTNRPDPSETIAVLKTLR
jgi:peroxiredoxin